jgi:primosomal protein N' (replication factor Y) (superfamily II helicase)
MCYLAHLFAEVIVPLPIADTFTYGIPVDLQDEVKIGMRVEVPFAKKVYAGIVLNIHNRKPDAYIVKPITSLIDASPILTTTDLKFWQWIAAYYVCNLGEVMLTVLPAYLKLSSETGIVRNEFAQIDEHALTDAEYMIYEALQLREEITLDEAQAIVNPVPVRKVLNSLIQKQAILIFENLKEAFRPKTEDVLVLNEAYDSDDALKKLFDELEKAPKQLHLLLNYLQLVGKETGVRKKEALEQSGASTAQLNALVQKGVFSISKLKVDRVQLVPSKTYETFSLSPEQEKCLQQITQHAPTKPCLLHGITGSGKTNVLIKYIEQILQVQKQVLYLVPEITLTAQLINKLYSYFGDALGVYHSKYSNNERVETWQNVRSGKIKILLGARSALFLPFTNLGAIIVDEEHDSSYKQFDANPRYQARDAAVVLANLSKAQIIFASATPSIETYRNTQINKYALVELNERFGDAVLPQIEIVDNKILPNQQRQSKLMSEYLIESIKTTLSKRKQVVLFQNRRGFAPYLFCGTCGWTASCQNCDVCITYHKSTDKLHCHYCGTKWQVFKHCPSCKSDTLHFKNYGTERVEEEVQRVFPQVIVDRLDTDTARTKNKYNTIIKNIEKNYTQVLVGTQMVAKGLDFENVQTVGVLNADALFTLPEYRVNERAFQLLSQVSGRAGRKGEQGLVLLQTANTHNHYLSLVQQHDYKSFYKLELEYRQQFNYPPFVRLIKISLRHRNGITASSSADLLAAKLRHIKEIQVLGPSEPMIARLNNYYYKEIILKISNDGHLLKYVKDAIRQFNKELLAQKGSSGLGVMVDVDC